MKRIVFIASLAIALTGGCKATPKSPGVRSGVETRVIINGRYQSAHSKIETREPLLITVVRDGKKWIVGLLPHPYSHGAPAVLEIKNPFHITSGNIHVDGPNPTVTTPKIRAVGVGTVMVVEMDPGTKPADPTDDIHRTYFLGGRRSGGVQLWKYEATGPPEAQITAAQKDWYVEFYCESDKWSDPKNLYDPANADRLAFVQQVCHLLEHDLSSHPAP